jgi:hypothetical protein
LNTNKLLLLLLRQEEEEEFTASTRVDAVNTGRD